MSHSAHLIEAHERKPVIHPYTPQHPSRPPHPSLHTPHESANGSHMGDSNDSTWISQHGFPPSSTALPRFSQWSEERVATLQARLARKLGPEYVTQRPGPSGGPKLSYIEGWKVINLANEVFGFNGWSSSIVSLTTDFLDQNNQGRVSVNVTAIVRITLQDGCFHEDVGCGQGENVKGKGAALDKAKKEAVTDATKRALKTFGNVLGNCLYDKDYAKEVVKVKVPPAKFDVSELERRPEFTEAGAGPSRASAVPHHMTNGMKPPPPLNIRPQSHDSPSIIPATPLRSFLEFESGDVLVDESFDGEFGGMEDAFFDEVNQSVQAVAHGIIPVEDWTTHTSTPAAGLSRSAASRPDQLTYQHRHRPDFPPAHPVRPNLVPRHFAAGQENQSSTSRAPQQLRATGSAVVTLRSGTIEDLRMSSGDRTHSSGSSSETVPGKPPIKTPVGGFVYPSGGGPSNPTGSSARALAISSALAAQLKMSAPIRSESPRIPSGGIDDVAAKASTVMHVHGAKLELDENETRVEAGFSGFASARGMKRSISGEDRNSVSPTKHSTGGPARYPQIQRTGPRRALFEIQMIPEPLQDDWGGKRQRPA